MCNLLQTTGTPFAISQKCW